MRARSALQLRQLGLQYNDIDIPPGHPRRVGIGSSKIGAHVPRVVLRSVPIGAVALHPWRIWDVLGQEHDPLASRPTDDVGLMREDWKHG